MTDLTREREKRAANFWREKWFPNHENECAAAHLCYGTGSCTFEFAVAFAQAEIASLQVERDEAKRLYNVAENAFKLQDAVSIPGRAGELNCLQIAKAWLALEKRAEKAEAEISNAIHERAQAEGKNK